MINWTSDAAREQWAEHMRFLRDNGKLKELTARIDGLRLGGATYEDLRELMQMDPVSFETLMQEVDADL